MKKTQILVDSTSDIPKEYMERYNISAPIPLSIVFGDEVFKDGVDITPQEIFDIVKKIDVMPKTSAVNQLDLYNFFKPYADTGDDIIYISISSKLSATYDNALLAAKQFPEGQVKVFDSQNVSMGIGIQCIKAFGWAEEGKTSEEIMDALSEFRSKVRVGFVADDLNYLWKGGRCSGLQAFAGTLLNIKPKIYTENGYLLTGDKFRGSKNVIFKKFFESFTQDKDIFDNEKAFLVHGDLNDEDVELAKQSIMNVFPDLKEIITCTVGGVISCHAGPHVLGFLYFVK